MARAIRRLKYFLLYSISNMANSVDEGRQLARAIFRNFGPSIKLGLERDGYYIYRDPELAVLIENAATEYLTVVNTLTIHPQKSRLNRHGLAEQPWRKIAIGATNGVGEPYAQFLTTSYFSPDTVAQPKLALIFNTLISLRNLLSGLPERLTSTTTWDACRVHHYPRGGGFMTKHRDTHFPKLLESSTTPFLQVSACMSRRGTDFHTGEGFLIDRSGKHVDLESFGSLVIFDGSVEHGVDSVDLDVVPDIASADGRLAAFVNIYEIL